MTVEVVVTGLAKAETDISPLRWQAALREGMQAYGWVVANAARAVIRPHRLTGRFEREIHPVVVQIGESTTLHVGVSASAVPEARPLTFGWKSAGGKQPPTQAIAEWLAHKPEIANSPNVFRSGGFVRRRGTIAQVSGQANIRSLAFLIARKIGRSGYSFPPLQTFSRAFEATRNQLRPLIVRALRAIP